MISVKLNLRQLEHAIVTSKAGNKVIVLPIKQNNFYEGEKGLYLDIVGFEMKNQKENGDTHLLKQSYSKEAREKMTDEELKAIPIIGNAKVSSSGGYSEPEPKGQEVSSDTLPDLPF